MQKNKRTITKDLCENNLLLFYPENNKEAEFIQKHLFAMGFKWGGSKDRDIKHVDDCVSSGMKLHHGGLWTGINRADQIKGILYSSGQFDSNFDPNALENLDGNKLILEVFNRLSARMDGLEKKIDEIKNPTYRKIEKPEFQKKQEL